MDIVLDSRLVDGSYSLHSRPADFHERIINVLLRRFNLEAYKIENVYSLCCMERTSVTYSAATTA